VAVAPLRREACNDDDTLCEGAVVAVSVAILGAGAVGGMLGVLLAKAGHDVTVLASERTSTAINVNGLVLHSARYGEWHVRVPARPWLTAPVDVLSSR
jgi:2-dehydropantoate 2-reductase